MVVSLRIRPRGWRVALAVAGLLLVPVAARAQRGWDGAQFISAILPFVSDARVAVDAQGVVTAAWIEGPPFVVRASRRAAVGWWTSPVALSSPLLGGADLVLAAATSGVAFAVWSTEVGVFVSRHPGQTAVSRASGRGSSGACR